MFLPTTLQELYEREIWSPDFIIISGDAYVDHPSFGHALIARLIESQGFSVAIIAQPISDDDYTRLGKPNCAFMVSSGVVDSMVNNYTVNKTRRTQDVYSNEGKFGLRPDRATITYCKALKRLFPDVPVIAGGVEASLRRLSHYDYWSDSVMRSIAYDSGADLIIYGMGEKPILELTAMAKKRVPLNKIKNIRGTAYVTDINSATKEVKNCILSGGSDSNYVMLPSHERVKSDVNAYVKAFNLAYQNTDPFSARPLIQKQDNSSYVVINAPSFAIDEKTMDFVYSLPFERTAHPSYTHVPALDEVEFSVTAHRGCFGSCSFCALTFHQGRIVSARSENSIIDEVKLLTKKPNFKGYIHDIGGPSANFHAPACDKQATCGACKDKECIGYTPCKNLKISHEKILSVLRRARKVNGVKKVFVRSGVRYDYLLYDRDRSFFNELIAHHVSGQLKVAPEHCAVETLKNMNKPNFDLYREFYDEFYKITKKLGKNQFLVPYFISSHPGCTLQDAINLTEYLLEIGYMPKQVQDFYPTPGTKSTTAYYTGINPDTLQPVFVAKTKTEKAMQRALLQYRLPSNRDLIEKACVLAGREDMLAKLGFNKLQKNRNKNGIKVADNKKNKKTNK